VTAVALAGAASATFMAGMIWTVQSVHYPLFARVGPDAFTAYAEEHRRRISALILLPWAVEGATALALAAAPPPGVPRGLALAGLAAAGVTVAATVGLAVPQHARLADGLDAEVLRRLVRGNWVRTAAWTAHAALALAILARLRPADGLTRSCADPRS
jgi:hypothetical protein